MAKSDALAVMKLRVHMALKDILDLGASCLILQSTNKHMSLELSEPMAYDL